MLYNQVPLTGNAMIDSRRANSMGLEPKGTLPAQKSLIAERFEILGKLVAENRNLLEELSSRLGEVCMPQPPANQQKVQETSSPVLMVAHIENLCQAVENNNFQIRNILQSLAL